jgi:hypothetical protein
MSTYAIFMIGGVIVVAGGWTAYFLWDRKMRKEEEQQPKPQSERVQKTKSELSDWAKKMAEYKGPPKRPTESEKTQDS